MSKSVWKAFYDYQKEENWLNEMSAKGLALTNYTWMHYTFEDSTPGEYIYRIELLDKDVKQKDSIDYLDFLKQSGVDFVASYMRWVYLRKKAADGPFEVYTDIDSRLAYLKRVSTFWMTFGLVLAAMAIVQIGWIGRGIGSGNYLWIVNVVALVVAGIAAAIFLSMAARYRSQATKLKLDKVVYD